MWLGYNKDYYYYLLLPFNFWAYYSTVHNTAMAVAKQPCSTCSAGSQLHTDQCVYCVDHDRIINRIEVVTGLHTMKLSTETLSEKRVDWWKLCLFPYTINFNDLFVVETEVK